MTRVLLTLLYTALFCSVVGLAAHYIVACDACAFIRRDWLLQCAKHRPYEDCAVDYEKLRTCPKETR